MKKMTTTCVALATTALMALPAAAEEKWDLPMAYSGSNFHSVTGAEFAKCVTTGTGGDIEITTHPSGSLFAGGDIKRAVQTGQVPIGERLLSGHQNESAIFGWDSVPFLVSSFDEHEKLYAAALPHVQELLAEQNMTMLYSVPWPPQGLYFKKEVNSVEDMKGVKFRSYNTATARLAELTGMLPVQIEAAEISQAFATGVAESMISSGATGYDRKVWEHLTHFYEVDAWMPRNHVFVNKDAWNDLDEQAQNCLRSSAMLAQALLPLIDADEDAAIELAQAAVDGFAPLFRSAYLRQFNSKLGLAGESDGDLDLIVRFLGLMAAGGADFTLSFRFLSAQIPATSERFLNLFSQTEGLEDWLDGWRERLKSATRGQAEIATAMDRVNPLYIPRNHLVEAAITAGYLGDFAPFHTLNAVCARPFDEQAAKDLFALPPRPEQVVHQTFCGT